MLSSLGMYDVCVSGSISAESDFDILWTLCRVARIMPSGPVLISRAPHELLRIVTGIQVQLATARQVSIIRDYTSAN